MSTVYQFPQLPIYNSILHPSPNLPISHSNKHIRLRFEHSLGKPFTPHPLQPIHSFSPPWTHTHPNIRFDLTEVPSSDNKIYITRIRTLIQEYPHHTLCLTDGSKTTNKAAYAYSVDGSLESHRIRNMASIFTAELMAIFTCLSHLSQLSPNGKYLLLTDSLSSLHSLMDPYSIHPLIQRIHLTLQALHSINTQITFIWIPGHIGLPEHDAVDRAAQQATSFTNITDYSLLPATDYKNHYRSLILKQWYSFWQNQSPNKLHLIKQTPTPWRSSYRDSRREEVVLARLRISHTRITHSHLINSSSQSPAPCPHCHEDNLTTGHMFTCSQLLPLRSSLNVPSSLCQALRNNSDSVSRSLQYLRLTQFFTSI